MRLDEQEETAVQRYLRVTGTQASVPMDTSGVVKKYLAATQPASLPVARPERSYGQEVTDRLRRAMGGFTFGLYPKMVGVLGGKEQRKRVEEGIAASKEEDTGIRGAALDILPGLVSAAKIPVVNMLGRFAPAAARMPVAGKITGQAFRAADAGATIGGAQALGEAEGSLQDQATETAKGALHGVGTALTIGSVLKGASLFGKGAAWLARRTGVTEAMGIKSRDLGVKVGAEGMLRQGTPVESVTRAASPMQEAAAYTRAAHGTGPLPSKVPDLAPAAAHVGSQEQLITRAGIRINPVLERQAVQGLNAMDRTLRAVGRRFDAATGVGQGVIPVAGPEIQQLVESPPVPAVEKALNAAWNRIGLAVREKMTVQTPAQGTTLGKAVEQGWVRYLPKSIRAMIPNDPAAFTPALKSIPVTIPGFSQRTPTMEWMHKTRQELDAQLKRKYSPVLAEVRDQLTTAMEATSPEFRVISEHYNAIKGQIAAAEAAYGAQWNPKIRMGKGGYEFPKELPSTQEGYLVPRAVGSLAMGSPAIAGVNITATAIKELTREFSRRGLEQATAALMQRGPRGFKALSQMAEQAKRMKAVADASRVTGARGISAGRAGGLLSSWIQ